MEKPSSPESPDRGLWRSRFRQKRLKHVALLPTMLTLANGVCGFLALLSTAEGIALLGRLLPHEGLQSPTGHTAAASFGHAALYILVAMIFDAVDGPVSRLTRTASNFGAQLDSLCDLISFGVAPAFLIYGLCHHRGVLPERVVQVACIFYAMCALLRLGRFTVETSPDEKSHMDFAGLPSPAAAGVVASAIIPWGSFENWPILEKIADFLGQGLPVIGFGLGVLMVSRVRYTHLVNRLLRGSHPFVTLVEVTLVAVLVGLFHEFALFLGFCTYALVGPVLWLRGRLFRKGTAVARTPAPDRDETLF